MRTFFRRTLADSQFNLNFPLKSYDRYSDYSASCVWYPSFLLLLRLSFIFPSSSSSLSLSLSLSLVPPCQRAKFGNCFSKEKDLCELADDVELNVLGCRVDIIIRDKL